jgi:hypothetical protein
VANIGKAFDRTSIGMTVLTIALLVAAMTPLFVVEIPAMLDYVNHLARMYLLSGPANLAYERHWGLYPDLAMDLIVPGLARWMSVAAAAKVFIGVSQVLVVTGAVFLELIVKGRHRLGGLGALLVLFSLPFAWGQINFMFGMGVAVWGIALWIWLKDQPGWSRWIVHAAAVAILFVSHFFDLGVYGLVVGLYELSCFRRSAGVLSIVQLSAFMASPVLVALAIMMLSSGGLGQFTSVDWNFSLKLIWAALFMNVYDTSLSILTAGVLLLLLLVLAAARRLSLTREGVWIAGGLAVIYLALPRQMFGSQYLDVRLVTAAMIILPAFASTSLPSGPWRIAPLTMVVAIVAANEFVTARAWVDHARDFEEFKASFAWLRARLRRASIMASAG